MIARRLVVGSTAALFACAPLLSYEDLDRAPDASSDGGGGTDAGDAPSSDAPPATDAGDLCRFAPETAEGFYCGQVLSDAGTSAQLWGCVDRKKKVGSPEPCALGCVVMPSGHADVCNRCDLGDGTYCAKEWRSDYLSVDDVLLTCRGGVATTKSCAGNCVHAAPASRCP